jgi:hypothetical protein
VHHDIEDLITSSRAAVARLQRATSDLRVATDESTERRMRLVREREVRQQQAFTHIDQGR